MKTADVRKIVKSKVKEDFYSFTNSLDLTKRADLVQYAMAIGYYNTSVEEKIGLIKNFVPYIESWEVCDTLMCGLREFSKKFPTELLSTVDVFRNSSKEFERRYIYVIMLHYTNDNYIDYILQLINENKSTDYYVKMAIAWLLCECFIFCPKKVYDYLCNSNIDKWIINKAISKCYDSYRISVEDKSRLKELRR